MGCSLVFFKVYIERRCLGFGVCVWGCIYIYISCVRF